MKLLITTAAIALGLAVEAQADIKPLWGCERVLVEGSNYYIFSDPSCPVRGPGGSGVTTAGGGGAHSQGAQGGVGTPGSPAGHSGPSGGSPAAPDTPPGGGNPGAGPDTPGNNPGSGPDKPGRGPKGNASANNGRGGNYDKTGHTDNGKGRGREKK